MPMILSYFHPIKGPSQMFIVPEEEKSEEYKEVTKLLDFVDKKGFFLHSFETFKTANFYFEVPSEWARGKREMALISVIFTQDDIDQQIFRIPLSEFVIEILSIKDIYKGFYLKTRSEGITEEIEAKYHEIGNLLQELTRVMPKEIVSMKKKSLKLFVFGLDRAGKTSILERIRQKQFVPTKRTLNLNLLRFVLDNVNLVAWDLGGQIGFRQAWRNYLKEPDILIFVLDISDKERIEEAKSELWRILNYPESDGIPLLILGNKKDLTNMLKVDIIKGLELDTIENREWDLQQTSAVTGEGIITGFQWIFNKLIQ